MYTDIYELPSQVLASLDTKDAKKWMDEYNKIDPTGENEIKDAKRKAWHKCKNLPSSFSFRIKATVDNIDKDREIIDVDSVKEHLDSYIDYGGNVQWEHGGYNVATIWDWEPIEVDGKPGVVVWGNIFGGDIVYDQMRKAFVEGKNSLSVAGEAAPGKFQCDDRGCYTRRNVKQLMEISLCAVPANNMCKMEWYNEKARIKKSASAKSEMRFNVDEYEIHKTYNECPMLSLKKSLEDIGYEAHATNAGVFVKMNDDHFQKALPYMHANNLHVIRIGDSVCLNDYDYLTELSFKKGYEEGYIDKDGYVLDSIQKSDFETLYERDILIQDDEGRYRLIPFGKVAKWKQFGAEGRKAVDESEQPRKGLHFNWGITNGTDETGRALIRGDKFDPEKFTLIDGYGRKPDGGYYEGVLNPNKHNRYAREGYGLTDAQMSYATDNRTGIITNLYPQAKILHIRDERDWEDVVNNHKYAINENGYKDIYWPSLLRDYDAIEFDMYHNKDDYRHNKKKYQDAAGGLSGSGLRDPTNIGYLDKLKITGPYSGRSNYRLILNPYAVMSSEPYDAWHDTTKQYIGSYDDEKFYDDVRSRYQSPRTTEWMPYDRKAALDKLRERYKQAGIEVNW